MRHCYTNNKYINTPTLQNDTKVLAILVSNLEIKHLKGNKNKL